MLKIIEDVQIFLVELSAIKFPIIHILFLLQFIYFLPAASFGVRVFIAFACDCVCVSLCVNRLSARQLGTPSS